MSETARSRIVEGADRSTWYLLYASGEVGKVQAGERPNTACVAAKFDLGRICCELRTEVQEYISSIVLIGARTAIPGG